MTPVDLVNRALEEIGDQVSVTSVFPSDGSPAANAANVLYYAAVDMVVRESHWDAARTTVILAKATGGTVPLPWGFEYLYPADCVQIRQIFPTTFDPLDPQPIRWAVSIDRGLNKKTVLALVDNALAVYSLRPTEDEMDPILREAIVKTLASSLAMALAGRPDYAKSLLEQSFQTTQIGAGRMG